jgi:hypothetical protein
MTVDVGLEENDQRIFLVDVRGREGRRVDGRLYCGFCREYYDICWHPDAPQLGFKDKAVLEHFRDCLGRGSVNSFDVTVFDGPGQARDRVHIRFP